MTPDSWASPVLALCISPLLIGIINRTKSVFAGRRGPPLLQPYYDLWKLLHKSAVYSRTTTWVFRAGPMIGLSALIMATFLLPFGSSRAPLAFPGDIILLIYLLGLARFFTVAAALDTGSPFEGMGASREVFFSALSEPVLLLSLTAVVREAYAVARAGGATVSDSLSLSTVHAAISEEVWRHGGVVVVMAAVVLFIVYLAENSRIPVDDPNTHLELTMIHEVMVLDHGGVDFAFILYGASLKLWILGSLWVAILLPGGAGSIAFAQNETLATVFNGLLDLVAMFALAIATGVVESIMARLLMKRVPLLLVGAAALAGLALILQYNG